MTISGPGRHLSADAAGAFAGIDRNVGAVVATVGAQVGTTGSNIQNGYGSVPGLAVTVPSLSYAKIVAGNKHFSIVVTVSFK